MYVKIHKTPEVGNNQGSSGDLFRYLTKEDQDKPMHEKEYFFNQELDGISPYKAQNIIDNNKKGLKTKDSKFFMITINPSERELAHIKAVYGDENSKEVLKDYTREVMDKYAQQFDKGVTGEDLVYFAKIETQRSYDRRDPRDMGDIKHNESLNKEVRRVESQIKTKEAENAPFKELKELKKELKSLDKQFIRNSNGDKILNGVQKSGDNMHVHVVVSRKDKNMQKSLSPHAKSRGSMNKLNGKEVKVGFNRDAFVEKTEKIFDDKHGFQRSRDDSYQHYRDQKHNPSKVINNIMKAPKDEKELAKRAINEVLKDSEVKKAFDKIPKNETQARQQVISKAVDLATKALAKNPATAPVALAQKVVTKAINEVSKAMFKGV